MKISFTTWLKEAVISSLVIILAFVLPTLFSGSGQLMESFRWLFAPFKVMEIALDNFLSGTSIMDGVVVIILFCLCLIPFLFLLVKAVWRRRLLWVLWSLLWYAVLVVSSGALMV